MRERHVLPTGEVLAHKVGEVAKMTSGCVTYPETQSLFDVDNS